MVDNTPANTPRIVVDFTGPDALNPQVAATGVTPAQWTMAAAVVELLARTALAGAMQQPAPPRILTAVPGQLPNLRET